MYLSVPFPPTMYSLLALVHVQPDDGSVKPTTW
jgi:hypothetical protein